MNHPTRQKKRIYLVNRDFQWRYVRIGLLVGLTTTALTLFFVLYPLIYFGILRYPDFMPPPFLAAMACAVVLNLLFVGWMGIILTHRIAGPMFAISRHLRVVQFGRLPPPIQLRQSDDLKYLARNLNEAVDGLRRQMEHDLSSVEKVISSVQSVPEALAAASELKTQLQQRLGLPGVASAPPIAGGPA